MEISAKISYVKLNLNYLEIYKWRKIVDKFFIHIAFQYFANFSVLQNFHTYYAPVNFVIEIVWHPLAHNIIGMNDKVVTGVYTIII